MPEITVALFRCIIKDLEGRLLFIASYNFTLMGNYRGFHVLLSSSNGHMHL